MFIRFNLDLEEMKTENSRKLTLLLATALILCLPMFGGCEKSETSKKRDTGGTLPLIGTTWKLVGFADSERNSFELTKPSGNETYLLNFKEDGSVSGSTSTNQARGKFVLSDKDKSLSIIEFTNVTEINELFDGYRYIDAVKKISSYQISTKSLSLYYGKGIYLLFHPEQ